MPGKPWASDIKITPGQGERWEWTPLPDITAYELAQVLFVIHYQGWDVGPYIRALPECVQRHFVLKESDW